MRINQIQQGNRHYNRHQVRDKELRLTPQQLAAEHFLLERFQALQEQLGLPEAPGLSLEGDLRFMLEEVSKREVGILELGRLAIAYENTGAKLSDST